MCLDDDEDEERSLRGHGARCGVERDEDPWKEVKGDSCGGDVLDRREIGREDITVWNRERLKIAGCGGNRVRGYE